MGTSIEEAKIEIDKSLKLSEFTMRRIGLSFDEPKTARGYIKQQIIFVLSICGICYHVLSEILYIGVALSNSPTVEEIVPSFHTFGYGALSIAKVFVLWQKKDVFVQLLNELAEIWPVAPLDEEYQAFKDKTLDALRIAHQWYFFTNVAGVWFYNLTPMGLYFYKNYVQGIETPLGFIWMSWYPFNKHEPVAHALVYIFEIFAGQTCVWIMVCTDLLFSGMASHIGLLLRMLHRKLEYIGSTSLTEDEQYEKIKENIRLHQRLIQYCHDLENAFSLSNFVNVVMSSVNICCVVFVIVLLEPFMEVSNKLFLCSALIQIGMLCWYADDIYHANADVAISAYKSTWYTTSPKCRKALIFLMKRAQKPIAFTAMNFTDITLATYTAILTRSYSYFALLYTMYSKK